MDEAIQDEVITDVPIDVITTPQPEVITPPDIDVVPSPMPDVLPPMQPDISALNAPPPDFVYPEYLDIFTDDGTIRILYEMSLGELIIAAVLMLFLLFLILDSIMKILWRR